MPQTAVFRAVAQALGERVKSTPPHALNQADIDRFSRILPGWLTEGASCSLASTSPAGPFPASQEPDHA